jgi:hypothetical protein
MPASVKKARKGILLNSGDSDKVHAMGSTNVARLAG